MHGKKPSASSSLPFSLLSCQRPSVFLVLFVCLFAVSNVSASERSPLLESLQRFKRNQPEGSINKYVNNKNASIQLHHRRRHRHLVADKSDNSTTGLLDKLRSNTKRCRYSSTDQEELENYAKRNQVKTSTTYEESFNYYGNHHLDYDEHRYRNHSGGGGYRIKQPRIREQSFGRHGHHQGGLLDPSVEIEKLFVDVGELVNLTCNINAKEIDWHFKDKNLTTTIISNGPFLQVEQSHIPTDNDVLLDGSLSSLSSLTRRGNTLSALKYRLSSDRHSSHMLTLYVQGNQDEGSYQCIDSKSETPIKKTIRLILKNNSRALTSGMASHSASLWLLVLALIAINRQIQ